MNEQVPARRNEPRALRGIADLGRMVGGNGWDFNPMGVRLRDLARAPEPDDLCQRCRTRLSYLDGLCKPCADLTRYLALPSLFEAVIAHTRELAIKVWDEGRTGDAAELEDDAEWMEQFVTSRTENTFCGNCGCNRGPYATGDRCDRCHNYRAFRGHDRPGRF